MMIKKILIIRTLKTELIEDVILYLKNEFKNNNIEIDLLTHPNQHTLNYFKNKFREIFIYNANYDFSKKYISQLKLKELKNRKYDLIIIPQMFEGKKGFSDVISLVNSFKAKNIAFFAINSPKLNYLQINEKSIITTNKIIANLFNIPIQLFFWIYFFFLLIKKRLLSKNNF
jgi:hypothetical protein